MKLFLLTAATVCMLTLSGCMSISEPPEPEMKAKFAAETNLKLDGFQLYSVREKQNAGYACSIGYDFTNDKWLTLGNSYTGTTYERMIDDKFPPLVKDVFESAGANIRSKAPQFTIEGRIGEGRYIWSNPAMWYRDIPVFVVSFCTLGMVLTHERENDVKLIVYNKDGKRLKEYSATERCYTSSWGLPLAYLLNEKSRTWYCDRMAAKFALIKCVNNFIRDSNRGFFK